MPDNSTKIAELESILDSGASNINVDGVSVAVDHDAIRRRLRELRAEDELLKTRRPKAAGIKLGGQF